METHFEITSTGGSYHVHNWLLGFHATVWKNDGKWMASLAEDEECDRPAKGSKPSAFKHMNAALAAAMAMTDFPVA